MEIASPTNCMMDSEIKHLTITSPAQPTSLRRNYFESVVKKSNLQSQQDHRAQRIQQ